MLKTLRKKLFLISQGFFLLFNPAVPQDLSAFSIIYLKNGSIYIGEVINQEPQNPESKKITDLTLKTELGIVNITGIKIDKIIASEKNLRPLQFREASSEKLIDARLLKKDKDKSVILANGKILEIKNEQLFTDTVLKDIGQSQEVELQAHPKISNPFHTGISLSQTTFPFAKIDQAQNNKVILSPFSDRSLWGIKAHLGYTPLPFLQFEIAPEYFTLYNPRKNDSFFLFSPIKSYSEKLDSQGVSLNLFLKFFESWLGIGAAYKQVKGNINLTFVNTQLNIIDDREIPVESKYLSVFMIWKHDYYFNRAISLSPYIQLSKDFIPKIYPKTNDPLLLNEFRGFYLDENYNKYHLEFALALLYHF